MELNDEQLKRVRELSGLFFSPRNIAILLQVDIPAFLKAIRLESSPVYLAFMAGRLQEELLVRKSVIEFAKKGSSPAQTMALKLLEESAAKMNDR